MYIPLWSLLKYFLTFYTIFCDSNFSEVNILRTVILRNDNMRWNPLNKMRLGILVDVVITKFFPIGDLNGKENQQNHLRDPSGQTTQMDCSRYLSRGSQWMQPFQKILMNLWIYKCYYKRFTYRGQLFIFFYKASLYFNLIVSNDYFWQ